MSRARDLRNVINSAEQLNRRYGNNFGYKWLVILLVVSMLYGFIALGVMWGIKAKDSNKEYVLDSNKKCIIYTVPRSGTIFYYEVDFEKNKVVERSDFSVKRQKMAEKELETNELEKLVSKITEENSNLTITDEEKVELFKHQTYTFYKIKSYNGREYYVKQKDEIEKIKKILDM